MENYIVQPDGRIFGKRYSRFLKPCDNGRYLQVGINGKHYYVHRLVAQKFIPNPNNYREVDHIDGNRYNNDVSNLRWVSPSMNSQSINKLDVNVGTWRITKHGTFQHRIAIHGKEYNKNFKNFAEMKFYEIAIKYALHQKYRV